MTRTRAFALTMFAAIAASLPAGTLLGEQKTTRLTIISTTDCIGELSPCG